MAKMRKSKNINAKGRSVFDSTRYLMLPYKMIQSPQFRGLKGNEVRVLLEICLRHNGFNNKRLGVSITDLSRDLLMSRSTASEALLALQAFGFVKCIKKGQLHGRLASEWEVTFLKGENYIPTNDWANCKARKKKRKKPPKGIVEEIMQSPEMMEAEKKKIDRCYEDQTE